MPLIRKAQAGSDSYGHTWPEDGAVVEVDDPEQVAALLTIPDGGFSEVTPGTRGDWEEFAEVSESDAPKSGGRRGRRPASTE
ncbi:hypothetical protein [Streptomyces mobaraensis]|uniref:Uncharacterized protein n=1 Tax=Streptomyces mobaraensis TaxID=35621 RepID=A0A5N5WEI5_STRMB|nr:hypothetical protein [Streptomyces mobaraensis]KAB7850127.1 hypothetical protein FRZ00_05870 [Streptomyces mobaraensis]